MGTWELEVKVKPGLRTVECVLMLTDDQNSFGYEVKNFDCRHGGNSSLKTFLVHCKVKQGKRDFTDFFGKIY